MKMKLIDPQMVASEEEVIKHSKSFDIALLSHLVESSIVSDYIVSKMMLEKVYQENPEFQQQTNGDFDLFVMAVLAVIKDVSDELCVSCSQHFKNSDKKMEECCCLKDKILNTGLFTRYSCDKFMKMTSTVNRSDIAPPCKNT